MQTSLRCLWLLLFSSSLAVSVVAQGAAAKAPQGSISGHIKLEEDAAAVGIVSALTHNSNQWNEKPVMV